MVEKKIWNLFSVDINPRGRTIINIYSLSLSFNCAAPFPTLRYLEALFIVRLIAEEATGILPVTANKPRVFNGCD